MTRKEVKELLPIIQAFCDGKTIQHLDIIKDKWEDIDEFVYHGRVKSYRIKPDSQPKYRPFANAEECMKEMRKHEPFGLVINKSNDREYNIQSIFIKNDILYIRGSYVGLVRAFNDYTFADGTPFGVKAEE